MSAIHKSLLVTGLILPVWLNATSSAPVQKPCPMDCQMFEEMKNFFNRPFHHQAYSLSSMSENDKNYMISIDLPGMDKKDISIETAGNRITVSGERKEESDSKTASKRSYSKFQQSYVLPDDANLETISATSVNGVLKITVPKTGKKPVKKIDIK